MRYTLDPAMPVLLRPDGAVQIGWDPDRAVLVRPPRGLSPGGLAALLRAMSAPMSAADLRRLAGVRGLCEPADLDALLAELVSAGVARPAGSSPATGRGGRALSVRVHGGGPLSELLADGLRCSGARVSRSSQSGGAMAGVDLVVLADSLAADPRLVRDLQAAGVPHLPVRVRDGAGLVGPLVIPGVSSCLCCVDLHRTDRDPAWPALAAQLREVVGVAGRPALLATAALALSQVSQIITAVRRCGTGATAPAAPAPPPATLNATLEVDVATQRITARRWPRHPLCGCWPGSITHRGVDPPRASGMMVGVADDDIKRGSARRNAKLASIPVGIAGRAALGAAKRLTGKSKDEVNAELMEKAANQLFSVLGELKGGAMKVGQALSVLEAAIPEEFGEPYREALTKLQKDAPPLPAAKVHRVLDGQLGTSWRDRFTEFDDKPVASASIGQVHKGVWHDGREVAVKIQYPGADEALRADLKTMRRLTSVLKQLAPGADVQSVVDELVERTEMELDYRLEAANQRAFAKAYEGHPHFVIPHVVGSSPKVVVSEWIEGKPLSEIIRAGSQEERDLAGARLFELTFDAPARVGLMHGDAHPGNFMLREDGRLVVIDFGAVAPLPNGLPEEMGIMIRLAQHKNYDLLLPTMEKVGFIRPGEQLPIEAIDEMLAQYVEPVQVPVFHYTRKWLQRHAQSNMENAPQQLKMARQMDLPAELAIPLRVIASNVAISCQLDCRVPVRALAEQLIPGYAE